MGTSTIWSRIGGERVFGRRNVPGRVTDYLGNATSSRVLVFAQSCSGYEPTWRSYLQHRAADHTDVVKWRHAPP